MGTPEFAVPSLDILVRSGYEVIAVVTSTDKLLGRGKKKMVYSPVKKYALDHDIKVLQPPNLKAPDFLEKLRSLKADLQVIVAFRMLPEVVWDMPPLGSVNLHGSLLPAYRGAAPINWAVIRGEQITGLTTFQLKHQIDTGAIIHQESIIIHPEDTAGDIHDRLMFLGAPLILKTVRTIEKGNVAYKSQDDSRVSHAPKIYHKDGKLDPELPSEEIKNKIQGLSPYPAAWINFDGIKIKLLRARVFDQKRPAGKAGELVKGPRSETLFLTKNGAIEILEIQPEGKSKMTGKDFANGYL